MSSKGSIFTYSGIVIDPLAESIDPQKFSLVDIAHSLSLQCRYTGHCLRFYSVAEHATRMAMWADEDGFDRDICAAILMHDAAEAYLTDLARPLKDLDGFGSLYRDAEDKLLLQIFKAFGLRNDAVAWETIHQYDEIALVTEQRDLMHPKASADGPWFAQHPREDYIGPDNPVSWEESRLMFLAACRHYGVKLQEPVSG